MLVERPIVFNVR